MVVYTLMQSRTPTECDFDEDNNDPNKTDCRRLFAENRIAQMIVQYGYQFLKPPHNSQTYLVKLMQW
jgi:hypothetical protein